VLAHFLKSAKCKPITTIPLPQTVCPNTNRTHFFSKYCPRAAGKALNVGQRNWCKRGGNYAANGNLEKLKLNKIAARWPAKAVAQFFYFFKNRQ